MFFPRKRAEEEFEAIASFIFTRPKRLGSYGTSKEGELAFEDFIPPPGVEKWASKGLRQDDAIVMACLENERKHINASELDELVEAILDKTRPLASQYDGDKEPPSGVFLVVTSGVAY